MSKYRRFQMVMALLLRLGSEFSWIEIGYEDTLTRVRQGITLLECVNSIYQGLVA